MEQLWATVKVENPASSRTLEAVGFQRTGTRLYRDLYDSREELYHFYRLTHQDLSIEKGGKPSDL